MGVYSVETYGLWSLVGVVATLLAMFDFGVAGATARLIAMNRVRADGWPIAVIMSTSLVILLVVGAVVGLLTLAAPTVFFSAFAVPPPQVDDVARAVLLSGFTVAISLPGSVFSGYLWGYERFDLLNAIEMPLVVLRTAAILVILRVGSSLFDLAGIIMLSTVMSIILRMLVCYWLDPGLRLRPQMFKFALLKEIYDYGFWYFLLSVSRSITPQIGSSIIGNRLGGGPVAIYAVARQLTGYINAVASDTTQVLAPRAASNYAAGDSDSQMTLFVQGGRFALALSLFLAGGAFCLGLPFIRIWQHGRLDAAYVPLMILTGGEILPMAQWLTYSTILAMSRHRILALSALVEGAAILLLTLVLLDRFGVAGVCFAVALPGAVLRGVGRWLYGCWLLKMSPWRYIMQVFAPVGLAAAVPIIAFAIVLPYFNPQTWLEFFGAGTIYAAIFAAVVAPILFG